MLRTLRPIAIDLTRVTLVRSADEAQLATPGGVTELVAELGLNEGIAVFPERLHAYFGGLRIWQYPIQFGVYLHHLGQLGVRSYLEVPPRWSFVTTIEYLRRAGTLERHRCRRHSRPEARAVRCGDSGLRGCVDQLPQRTVRRVAHAARSIRPCVCRIPPRGGAMLARGSATRVERRDDRAP